MGAPLLPELENGKMKDGLLFNRMDTGPLFDKAGSNPPDKSPPASPGGSAPQE